MNVDNNIIIAIVILVLLIYYLKPAEYFNTSYYGSSLEADMDKIKDKKGYTLNDYILSDNSLYGTGINSPF